MLLGLYVLLQMCVSIKRRKPEVTKIGDWGQYVGHLQLQY